MLGYLYHGHHLSHKRLVAVCRSVLGLRISEGAIAAALARLAERAQPAAVAIREQVRTDPVINADETGGRVDGRNRRHWVFKAPAASYHVIVLGRGTDVIALELLVRGAHGRFGMAYHALYVALLRTRRGLIVYAGEPLARSLSQAAALLRLLLQHATTDRCIARQPCG